MTRTYRRRPTDLDGKLGIVVAGSAPNWRNGVILAQENDSWTVSAGGFLGDDALAFADGDYMTCVEWLKRVHHIAHRCGGSLAQCDLIHLTYTRLRFVRSGLWPARAQHRSQRAGSTAHCNAASDSRSPECPLLAQADIQVATATV